MKPYDKIQFVCVKIQANSCPLSYLWFPCVIKMRFAQFAQLCNEISVQKPSVSNPLCILELLFCEMWWFNIFSDLCEMICARSSMQDYPWEMILARGSIIDDPIWHLVTKLKQTWMNCFVLWSKCHCLYEKECFWKSTIIDFFNLTRQLTLEVDSWHTSWHTK